MVEVFKTNVQHEEQSEKIIEKLLQEFPELNINFDLEDCDKILRVKGLSVPINEITESLNLEGYRCEILF